MSVARVVRDTIPSMTIAGIISVGFDGTLPENKVHAFQWRLTFIVNMFGYDIIAFTALKYSDPNDLR